MERGGGDLKELLLGIKEKPIRIFKIPVAIVGLVLLVLFGYSSILFEKLEEITWKISKKVETNTHKICDKIEELR